MTSTALLSEFGLFKGLTEALLKKIAAISDEASAAKGDFIFREGQKADKLHFLISGSIALRVKLTSKPQHVTVSFVNKPYEIFGWSGVVAPNYYTASAECEENTKFLVIACAPFMKLLEQNPESGFKVMQRVTETIADRLRNSRQALLKTM